ncbi:MAG: hypothetical protein QOJ25_1298, partial [Solirubrobacteraceae bacterium]|nr:hypothetical protein [Solirubrobacteraceae bacterium]
MVGFGQGLLVDNAGVGHFVCAGDTTLDPSAQPLHYGTNTLVDRFQCASRTNGMTCTDQRTGHGFFIAIQGW